MNDLELIFSMLGEASTTEIIKTQNPKGFIQNKKAAKQGGAVAGNARRELESRTGKKVVSSDNYLPEAKKNNRLDNPASKE
jgi:DNA-damage-inducible protein D